jgi:hypothetical protein
MSRQNTIPKGAYVTRSEEGIATREDGSRIGWAVKLYQGRASDGHKTGYEARVAYWLLILAEGKTFGCWRYTGERLPKAISDFESNVRDLSAAS